PCAPTSNTNGRSTSRRCLTMSPLGEVRGGGYLVMSNPAFRARRLTAPLQLIRRDSTALHLATYFPSPPIGTHAVKARPDWTAASKICRSACVLDYAPFRPRANGCDRLTRVRTPLPFPQL